MTGFSLGKGDEVDKTTHFQARKNEFFFVLSLEAIRDRPHLESHGIGYEGRPILILNLIRTFS